MDLKEIAEAYQLVYEKKKLDPVGKEDDDVDNDGDVDSSDEYLKKRRAAIGKAMGKDGDKEEEEEKKSKKEVKEAYGKKKKKKGHDCASKVKHEQYGIGNPVKGMHDLDESGKVAHYDVLFDHGVEKNVPVTSLEILEEGMHEHVIHDDKDKEVLWSNPSKDLMSAYYSMYEHHQKDKDGNTIPHEDEIEEEVEQLDELSTDTLKSYIPKAQKASRTLSSKKEVAKKKQGIDRAVDKVAEKEVYGRTVKKPKGTYALKNYEGNKKNYLMGREDRKGHEDYGKFPKSSGYREEVDLSFVDQLTEQELDNLVEGVVYDLLDEGIELDAIEGAFTEYLEEAKVTMGHDSYGPQTASRKEKKDVKIKQKKEKAEARAKASVERAEKFKKSVGKAVTGMKAKMHGGMADYAGKRGLMPTKAAAAAKKPTKVYKSKKYKTPEGEKKYAAAKAKEAEDLKKYNKVKDKKQSSGNIKVSMMGGGAKDTRSKLRSAVFKDVKDRVGKKAKAVIDAPAKAAQGIRSLAGKGKRKIGRSLIGLGQKMAEQGGELDMFDTVTAYLIDEGLVRDFDHAQRVMTTLDSTLIEEVHAQQLEYLKEYGGSTDKPMLITKADKTGNTKAYQNYKAGMKSKVTGKPMYQAADHMKNESLEDAYLKVYEEEQKPPRTAKGAMAYDGPNKAASEARDRIIAKTKKKMENK